MRLLPLSLLIFAAAAQAQQDAPPPPPLDTRTIDATADAATPAPPRPPASALDDLPPKEQGPDAVVPEVSIRPGKDGGRIEEYRENGRLLYVRVVPERGIPYVLIDADNDGEVDRAPQMSNEVLPVFYDINLPKRDRDDQDE